MEREGPNVRPARLDFPESGGGWAILVISYDALHARWLRARCEDADGTAAKVMMYVTADFDEICLIFCLFAEWFAATKPEGGHNMRSIVALRRAIEKYGCCSRRPQPYCLLHKVRPLH